MEPSWGPLRKEPSQEPATLAEGTGLFNFGAKMLEHSSKRLVELENACEEG